MDISNVIEREFCAKYIFGDQSHVTIGWNTRETGDRDCAYLYFFLVPLLAKIQEINRTGRDYSVPLGKVSNSTEF